MSLMRTLLQRALLFFVAIAGCSVWATSTNEGISLSRTRVIFLSSEKAQTVTMQNHGSRAYLVQSAVIDTPGGRVPAPFMTTPPLFRLEPDSKNMIRILRKDDTALPTDRESVFYFTAIAVPATAQPKDDEAAMSARVSVGIQNTIKLFWRPIGLPIQPEEAEGRLTFEYHNRKVRVSNPTPYYITFSRLTFDGINVNVRDGVSMIAPFSEVSYPTASGVRQARWSVINDYGGSSQQYTARVQKGGAS